MSGLWISQLLPASWRGVPFGVLSATIRPGRQIAQHTYPYRQTLPVWAEDIGAAPAPFAFSGFLVDGDLFAGGLDIFSQRNLMLQACLQAGPGQLVHPSLGSRIVALAEPCEMVERLDLGGAIELSFRFIETAPAPLYPVSTSNTQSATANAAAAANAQSALTLSQVTAAPLLIGAAPVGAAGSTVTQWTALAEAAMQTATRYTGAVAGLAGTPGRYNNGSRTTVQPGIQTAATLLAAATVARTAVTITSASAIALAGGL